MPGFIGIPGSLHPQFTTDAPQASQAAIQQIKTTSVQVPPPPPPPPEQPETKTETEE